MDTTSPRRKHAARVNASQLVNYARNLCNYQRGSTAGKNRTYAKVAGYLVPVPLESTGNSSQTPSVITGTDEEWREEQEKRAGERSSEHGRDEGSGASEGVVWQGDKERVYLWKKEGAERLKNRTIFLDGPTEAGHPTQTRDKQGFASTQLPVQTQQSAAVPMAQAQQQMQTFMQGQPYMAGQGMPQTGLDGPSDTSAQAMPGTPGHAATNVIDQKGGLDPRGQTVDGNNAAGVPKGFKIGSAGRQTAGKMGSAGACNHEACPCGPRCGTDCWSSLLQTSKGLTTKKATAGHHTAGVDDFWSLGDRLIRTKAAAGLDTAGSDNTRTSEEEKQYPDRQKSRFPWLGAGLGAGALGSYGLSQALASDSAAQRARQALTNYDPQAFTQGKLPPNQTGLTYYQRTMSPLAQLKPFGTPIGDISVAARSDPDLMEAMGTQQYALENAAKQEGVGGRAHYDMFAKGPVSAYQHQLKAKLHNKPVPEALSGSPDTRYSDWMGRKLEDFVAQETKQRINPFEFSTDFMPHEEQVKLMEKFHDSLSPEEQQFRLQAEDPGKGYADQVQNYKRPAEAFLDTRQLLKDIAVSGGGAAAGAVGGNLLYDVLSDAKDKKKDPWGRALASVGGAGLGGSTAYFLGTERGREAWGDALRTIKRMGMGLPAQAKTAQASGALVESRKNATAGHEIAGIASRANGS